MIPMPHPKHLFAVVLAALTLAFATRAQDLAKEEQDVSRQCVSALSTFATVAKSNKVGQRAKQAFDLILQYDPDHRQARSELGYKREKDAWVELPNERKKRWRDDATYENRFKVMDQWAKTAIKLGELHRGLGLKMKAAGQERSKYHLEKAIYYNAMDREANLALGYKEGPGFFGTDPQIAMAKRMREIETTAIQIARKDYPVEALPFEQMPIELVNLREAVPDWMKKPHFDIYGAKSAHFTVWCRGTQENADNAVKWGERALDFGVYLLGEKMAKQLRFVERASGAFAWRCFVWTMREREEMLKANPHMWQGQAQSVDEAMRFVNNNWQSQQGGATVQAKLAPVQIHDSMIGTTFMYGLAYNRNEGLGEGLIHAATWYLQYTSITRYGALPQGTMADRELALPESTTWWLRAVRDQAVSNQDWDLRKVPVERLSEFRNDCRLKSWSFMTWVMAAYPDQWLQFFLSCAEVEKTRPSLDQINELGTKAFGKPLTQVEEEWREWARGDSGFPAGTGYGPPLLPERPSKEELAVLDRLNAVRGHQLGYTWGEDGKMTEGKFVALPPCELDAEASLACESHARFLTMHPEEHLKWPEAHEENPALEGFSPRGQRAAMGSVIIHRQGNGGVEFARDSVDGWLGTPYHRFPLLEHNIKRFGYSFLYENDLSVAVLDMGSLEEPYDPVEAPKFILWPPHGMKNVPTDFHGIEHPNPLDDQPENVQDITKTGYPISLQMQREIAGRVAMSDIQVYEARSSGRQPAKHFCPENQEDFRGWADRCKKQIDVWVHTPQVPLNRRVEVRDTVFCIPKEKLSPNKHYQVRCKLQIGGADPLWFIWEFSTGTQAEGLKLK
jgi:hypothetical protein